MADNVILPGTGATIGCDQVSDATLGSVQVQYVKIMGGALDDTTKVGANSNGLLVDGSGVTQPVSLSSVPTHAVTQSGTWTVQPGNTANTTAWKVDGSAVTQPVSAASLPLPSGAATSAKQPALGTAGTASSDVLTVQGITSMTALKVDGSAVTQPVSGTVTVQQSTASSLKVDLSGTAANTTAIKVDGSAVTQPVSLASVPTHAVTQSGTWTVQPGNTANTTAWKVDGSSVTQPVSGTFWQATQPVSGTVSATLTSTTNAGATAKTSDYDTGAGTDTLTMFGVALPASGGAVAGGTSTNPLRTDPTGSTTQPVSGTVTANAGTGTMAVSAASLPLPSGASTSAKQPALGTAGSASADVITVQGVASMTALKVDGSAVTQPVSGTFWQATQPVSAASLPLPSGAATSAKQPALGTAGTAASDVITVQGIASMTALKVDGSGVTQPVSGTVTANVSQVAGSTVSTAATGIQKVGIADSLGQPQYNFPAGFVRTSDEPRQVFYDPFDAAPDTTNVWTTATGNSGVAGSVSGGLLSLGTGTTASGWSKFFSIPTFRLPIPGWMGFSFAINIPDLAAPTANSYRFWGSGTIPTTPTTAAPLTDAIGFELTTAGKMVAVVYAAGVRTAVQDLSAATGNATQPTDANSHRYLVYVRTDKAYFYIDGLSSANLVATSNFQAPAIQTLPLTFLAVGGSTPPSSNSQIQCNGAVVWDTGKNATQVADGTFPWRRATVSSAGALKVDNSAVTQPVSGTFWQATQPVSGTVTVQQSTASSLKVDLSGTAANTTAIKVDGSAVTQPVSGTVSANASQTGTWTVQPGNTANSTPWLVQTVPGTANGWSASSQTALSNTKTSVKSSAGLFGGYMLYNPNATVVYIQVWDVALASVTVGSTAPTYVIPIPGTAGANLEIRNGITHATAIVIAATTTPTGSTAPGTAIVGFILNK